MEIAKMLAGAFFFGQGFPKLMLLLHYSIQIIVGDWVWGLLMKRLIFLNFYCYFCLPTIPTFLPSNGVPQPLFHVNLTSFCVYLYLWGLQRDAVSFTSGLFRYVPFRDSRNCSVCSGVNGSFRDDSFFLRSIFSHKAHGYRACMTDIALTLCLI